MDANFSRKSGKDTPSLARLKARLEVVTEAVGEASGEWTDRNTLHRLSRPRKSSFVVEKIDYHPTDDECASADRSASSQRQKGNRLLNATQHTPRLAREKGLTLKDSGPATGLREMFGHKYSLPEHMSGAFRTPHKAETSLLDASAFLSPLSPRVPSDSGKQTSGFFSVRKKTAPAVREHIKVSINTTDCDRHQYQIELPGGTGMHSQWVMGTASKEARDTATTAAGGPTPTNSGGKIKIVNNIFQNTILQGVPALHKPAPHQSGPSTNAPSSKPKPKTRDPRVDTQPSPAPPKSSSKRKMNLSLDHRESKKSAAGSQMWGMLGSGLVSPKHKPDLRHFSFSGTQHSRPDVGVLSSQHTATFGGDSVRRTKRETDKPVPILDESQLMRTNGSRQREGVPNEASSCFTKRSVTSQSAGGVLLTANEAAHFEKLKKFHNRLSKLMRDTGVDGQPNEPHADDVEKPVGLGESWRFIKKVVVGYVEAKNQLRELQKGEGRK